MVGAIDDLNLLRIILEEHDQFQRETKEELMILGFFRLPKLYDQSIGTEFEEEVGDTVSELIDSVKDENDKDQPDPTE